MDSQDNHSALSFTRLAALFGLFYFWQGLGEPTDGLLTQPIRELLHERGQSIDEISGFVFLLSLPWTVKPLYGLISDGLPLAGYRRKSYLVVASAVSAVAYFLLAAMPSELAPNQLFWLLLPPAVAVAFSDVAIDALMIERAQPLGWTGQLQSIQWTCMYGAGVLAGWAGGYLSEHHLIEIGYLVVGCGSIVSLVLAIVAHEDPSLAKRAAGSQMLRHLKIAWRTPVLPAAAAFLLLWAFNPFSNTVLQVHMRDELNLSPQFFGETVSWNSLAAMAGTACYGLIRSRIKNVRVLLHGAIILGIVTTLAYWAMRGEMTARATSAAAGFTGALALLVQLDLAALVCPPAIAGTVFAVLMSLSNLSTFCSERLGGRLYDLWRDRFGGQMAFDLLVAAGALTTAACWLVMPWLSRKFDAHAPRT